MKNKLTETDIKNILKDAKVTSTTVFDKCTIVAVQLPNGFVIVESSACVDPENYDDKTGFDLCMARIVTKIYELEGYKLQDKVSRKKGRS